MTKNEIKAAIENAAAKIENSESVYVESVSAAMGLNPEYAGVIVTKSENGDVKAYVDNGECYPAVYGVDEFAGVYGDDVKGDAAAVTFDELKSAFVDFAEEKTPEFAAQLIDEYFPNAENREKLIEELLVG